MSSKRHLPQLPAVRLGKYVDSKPAVDILSLIIRVGNSKNTCVHAYIHTYIYTDIKDVVIVTPVFIAGMQEDDRSAYFVPENCDTVHTFI